MPEDGIRISVTTVPSAVRIRLRTRFRYWRMRRRTRKMGIDHIVRDFERSMDEAILFGERRNDG